MWFQGGAEIGRDTSQNTQLQGRVEEWERIGKEDEELTAASTGAWERALGYLQGGELVLGDFTRSYHHLQSRRKILAVPMHNV